MGTDPSVEAAAEYAALMTGQALAAAQRKLRPSPLDLIFDPKLAGCIHKGQIWNAITMAPVKGEWFRVGIRNSGARAIDQVRVQAFGLDPDTFGSLPVQLHRK